MLHMHGHLWGKIVANQFARLAAGLCDLSSRATSSTNHGKIKHKHCPKQPASLAVVFGEDLISMRTLCLMLCFVIRSSSALEQACWVVAHAMALLCVAHSWAPNRTNMLIPPPLLGLSCFCSVASLRKVKSRAGHGFVCFFFVSFHSLRCCDRQGLVLSRLHWLFVSSSRLVLI